MQKEYELNSQEFWLVQDPGLFYTKHQVIQKVYALMGAVSGEYSKCEGLFPPEVLEVSPKIYRGENYEQLPYVMLDQPRFFKGDDVFAVRSLFWWGQHFSVHLVLSGSYKLRYEPHIFELLSAETLQGWHITTTNNPWHHHFNEDNYTPVGTYDPTVAQGTYLKLGKSLPLAQWNAAFDFFAEAYQVITALIVRSAG